MQLVFLISVNHKRTLLMLRRSHRVKGAYYFRVCTCSPATFDIVLSNVSNGIVTASTYSKTHRLRPSTSTTSGGPRTERTLLGLDLDVVRTLARMGLTLALGLIGGAADPAI